MKKAKNILQNDLLLFFFSLLFFLPAILLDAMQFVLASKVLYVIALLIGGASVFADALRGLWRRDLLDEKFLMSIASVGAMIIGEYTEGVAVMLFFGIGEYLQKKAVAGSRASIRSLMQIRPDVACVALEDGEREMDADEVEVGQLLILRPGDRVPLDCVVLRGSSDVDTSALTGESVPIAVHVGDTLDSGALILGGTLHAKVLRIADESAAARILEMVENAAEHKSKQEAFITRFSRVYTPIVVACALVLALVPPLLFGQSLRDYIGRALVFLVVSCPCALVISVPMAFFGGIGGAAKRGILYKGGNVMAPLCRARTFAFDKTGTLTAGAFSVCEVHSPIMEKKALLRLAAAAEYGSRHPIARAVKDACPGAPMPEEFEEIPGGGVIAMVEGHKIFVGNERLLTEHGMTPPAVCTVGSVLYVGVDGTYAGAVVVTDTLRSGTADALAELRSMGVKKIVMLSGDRPQAVEAAARALSLDEAHGALRPEDKFTALMALKASGGGVVYVGDGINDAPVLALADVGIAMGGIGSDSAIEAADVVIMGDRPEAIPLARAVAGKTLRIAKENIVFALGVKLAVLLLGALGVPGMMWWAVFADVGVALLAILNAMRTLSVS